MNSAAAGGSVALDPLDEQIIRSLQLDPRAPFSRIAAVLDVSEQTVARRYRALQRAGLLRVVAVVNPSALGESLWIVRVKTRPEATLDVGRALAQRQDIGWVSVSAGGSELVCAVRSETQEERERLLLDRLPRSAAVLDVSAAVILHRFLGGSASDWLRLGDVLTRSQARSLNGDRRVPRRATSPEQLSAADYAMLDVLAGDGRAPVGRLASAAGISANRAARRLDALLGSGVVYLDIDLPTAALGYPTSAYIWLTVPPARIDATGTALAGHVETAFVAAISGRANLVSSVACRSLEELYWYVTERVGAIEGVQSVEVSPVLRRLKQAGTLMDGDRLLPG